MGNKIWNLRYHKSGKVAESDGGGGSTLKFKIAKHTQAQKYRNALNKPKIIGTSITIFDPTKKKKKEGRGEKMQRQRSILSSSIIHIIIVVMVSRMTRVKNFKGP